MWKNYDYHYSCKAKKHLKSVEEEGTESASSADKNSAQARMV